MRFGVVLLMLSHTGIAPPIGSHRGQLDLHSRFFEGGVSALQATQYTLELTLEIAPGGAAILRARGRGESTLAFRQTPPRAPSTNTWTVDDTWNGEVAVAEGEQRLTLRRKEQTQVLRCAVSRERVAEQMTRVLRCDPITVRAGFAWNDPLPAYLRAPLILAVGGEVRAEIHLELPVGKESTLPPSVNLFPPR